MFIFIKNQSLICLHFWKGAQLWHKAGVAVANVAQQNTRHISIFCLSSNGTSYKLKLVESFFENETLRWQFR